VFVQSFETGNLKALAKQLKVPLVQLFDAKDRVPADLAAAGQPRTYGELATPEGLKEVARYADGVGPSKDYIVPRDAGGVSQAPTTFIADAHAAGLLVHPYTFRAENSFLPAELRYGGNPADYGNVIREMEQFFALGVDGIFTDNADIGVEARG
jgi:glycerophosphoryl diester phosphodiesterase